MKLYDINQALVELMEKRELLQQTDIDNANSTISIDFDNQFEQLQLQFAEKVDNICKYMRCLETDNDALDSEIERLAKHKQSNVKKYDRLKSYLASNLQQQGLQKMETDLFKLSFRKSVSINIIDTEKVPDDFKKKIETIKVDAVGLKSWLIGKDDPKQYGAELVQKENIQIK